MEIIRAGTQASVKGPSEWFTGDVRIDRSHRASQSYIDLKCDRLSRLPIYFMVQIT